MTKVAVVIPCYNAASFVERAIDSVLAQLDVEVELVCVDNNSSDNTLEVLNQKLKDTENAKVLSENKKGACAARNKGLNHVSSNWVQSPFNLFRNEPAGILTMVIPEGVTCQFLSAVSVSEAGMSGSSVFQRLSIHSAAP